MTFPKHSQEVESPATQGWKGLKLKMQLGLDSVGKFYSELVSTIGSAVGVADGEPYTECLSGAMAGLG